MIHKDPLNVIVCGVGGQGNVLASQIIGRAFAKAGHLVSVSNVYGAAQRGGAVSSHIRISRKSVWAPVIPRGRAHLILSFEPLEALRALIHFGYRETTVITNSYAVAPLKVMSGKVDYPASEKIKKLLSELSEKAFFINATHIVSQLGVRYLSAFMIGTLVGTDSLPLNQKGIEDILRESFRAEMVEVNIKAFKLGIQAIAQRESNNCSYDVMKKPAS